jgi:TolB protein
MIQKLNQRAVYVLTGIFAIFVIFLSGPRLRSFDRNSFDADLAVPLTGDTAPSILDCGTLSDPLCSIEEAEALVGFRLVAPAHLPEGLNFAGVTGVPGKNAIQVYNCGEGCQVLISQMRSSGWMSAGDGPESSEMFLSGDNHFLFYSAGPLSPLTSMLLGEELDIIQELRWDISGPFGSSAFLLNISITGAPEKSSHLTKEDLIDIAHDMLNAEKLTGWIAFQSDWEGNHEIYVTDNYSREVINLTNHPAEDHTFAWSPDGEKIAFLSDRTGSTEIFTMLPDGSDIRQLSVNSGVEWSSIPAWSRDGDRLAMTAPAQNGEDNASLIYLVHGDGSGFLLLSEEPVYTDQPIKWSPDGAWIAYAESFVEERADHEYIFAGNSGLKAISVDGQRKIKLSGEENRIVAGFDWSPDGERLAYLVTLPQERYETVWFYLVDSDGTELEHLVKLMDSINPTITDFVWSPNGEFVGFIVTKDRDYRTAGMSRIERRLLLHRVGTDHKESMEIPDIAAYCRMSWSPSSKQILLPVDSGFYGHQVFFTSLVNQDSFAYYLHGAYIGWLMIDSGSNTIPQWQPRP